MQDSTTQDGDCNRAPGGGPRVCQRAGKQQGMSERGLRLQITLGGGPGLSPTPALTVQSTRHPRNRALPAAAREFPPPAAVASITRVTNGSAKEAGPARE